MKIISSLLSSILERRNFAWWERVCKTSWSKTSWSIFNHMRRLPLQACVLGLTRNTHALLRWNILFLSRLLSFYLVWAEWNLSCKLHLGDLRQSTSVHNWILKMRSRSLTLLKPSYSYTAPTHNPLGEGARETGVKPVTCQHWTAPTLLNLVPAWLVLCIVGNRVVKSKGHKLKLFIYWYSL